MWTNIENRNFYVVSRLYPSEIIKSCSAKLKRNVELPFFVFCAPRARIKLTRLHNVSDRVWKSLLYGYDSCFTYFYFFPFLLLFLLFLTLSLARSLLLSLALSSSSQLSLALSCSSSLSLTLFLPLSSTPCRLAPLFPCKMLCVCVFVSLCIFLEGATSNQLCCVFVLNFMLWSQNGWLTERDILSNVVGFFSFALFIFVIVVDGFRSNRSAILIHCRLNFYFLLLPLLVRLDGSFSAIPFKLYTLFSEAAKAKNIAHCGTYSQLFVVSCSCCD